MFDEKHALLVGVVVQKDRGSDSSLVPRNLKHFGIVY